MAGPRGAPAEAPLPSPRLTGHVAARHGLQLHIEIQRRFWLRLQLISGLDTWWLHTNGCVTSAWLGRIHSFGSQRNVFR
eukprot:Skav234784  [mRNA]  locus=scaffold69:33873:34109:- [translate_table: standard]